MTDKETVLNLIQSLPPEASLTEILQGIQALAATRSAEASTQLSALRTSPQAAAILSQALADHQASQNAAEN